MHKLDPNDMDALFRDGADKHEFAYNPEAWAMMEEKLDAKDRRKFFLWFFLGAIFIAGFVGIYLSTDSVEQPDPIATNSSIDVVSNKGTVEKPINIDVRIVDEEELRKNDNSELREGQNTKQLKNTSKMTEDNKSESKEEYINAISKVRSSNIVAQNSFQSENTGSLVKNEVVSIFSPTEYSTPNNLAKIIIEEGNKSKETKSTVSIIQKDETSRDLLIIDQLRYASNNILLSENKKELGINLKVTQTTLPFTTASSSRHVLSVFGSSDLSSVGFFSDPQAGFTVGAKVGVQLAHKFQLDVGFAYSLKKYGSEGINYNIDGGWNTMVGIDPTWMDGKGNILQVPIEATYYFNGYENNSYFVNAGISSFLFNSEWYGFKYDETELLQNPNATPIPEITMDDINRRNVHPAGIARLSIGYQKIISTNMAFELSPYLQIPLTGIGEGKVDLYTTGIQFAVKFNTK